MTEDFPLCMDRPLHAPVVIGPHPLSFRDLRAATHATARTLSPHSGEVLIACEDRTRFIVGLLAAWSAGHSVALPPNLRPATLQALSQTHAFTAVLTDREVRMAPTDASQAPRLPALRPDRVVASVYTSGSTGEHRASIKRARQLLGEAQALARVFAFGPDTRLLATVPPHHIYGLLFGVLAPLVGGATIVAVPALHAPTVASVADAHRATVLVSTPAHLRGLGILEPKTLDSVSHIYSSGAPLRPTTSTMLIERFGVRVVEVFGSTETGGIAWRDAADEDVQWAPLPGVEVRADRDGALLLRSSFGPDPLHFHRADDRIDMTNDGRFWHRGRIDDVVKVGGKRVSLGSLQRRLLELDGVDDAAILAEPTPDGRGTRIRAAVVSRKTPEAIREGLCAWFDPVAIPRRILVVSALPREPTGKLRRDALEALFTTQGRPGIDPRPRRLAVRPLAEVDSTQKQQLQVEVPDDLLWFRGHFEGHPILPGVVQIEQIVQSSIHAWPSLGRLCAIRRLKFKRAIAPGDSLTLDLWRSDSNVRFELRRKDDVCASGALVFSPNSSSDRSPNPLPE